MENNMQEWIDHTSRKDTSGISNTQNTDKDGQPDRDQRIGLFGATTEWLLSNRRSFLAAALREWLQAEAAQNATTMQKQNIDAAAPPELRMTNPNSIHFGTEGLAAIIEDVWSVERHLQPDFDIAVLYAPERAPFHKPQDILGVMTTSARPALGGVYIQGFAIHPHLLNDPGAFVTAAGLLVEAGIDVSIHLGMRGWVMCHADDVHAVIWRALGFSRQSGPLFQRMGYFDRQPIDRQGR